MKNAFGRLRTMMNQEVWTEDERHYVWELCHDTKLKAPEEYEAQWIPYLEGFPDHFEEPFTIQGLLPELEAAVELLPHALFVLHLDQGPIQDVNATLSSALIRQVRGLCLSDLEYFYAMCRSMEKHPEHWMLEAVSLHRVRLSAEDLEVFLSYPGVVGLKSLSLKFCLNELDIPVMNTLIRHASTWSSLELLGARFVHQSMETLAGDASFSNLRHLNLSRCMLNPARIELLCSSLVLQGLTSLSLEGASLNDDAIFVLTQGTGFEHLRELDLRQNHITGNGAQVLAECEHLSSLYRLDLRGNRIKKGAQRRLAESPYLEGTDVICG